MGQEEAISNILDIILKPSLKESPKSFLLVGQSGVGKTLLVKEYARLLYSKECFIKIDMSEYRDASSISKIIGSAPGYIGYDDRNTILEKVKLHPYSVILLDEIEKAHSSVLKLFLQVLDDGIMTTSYGDVVSFKNCVIFMTSNLGFQKKSIGFIEQEKSMVINSLKSFLGVELFNRLDSVVLFHGFSDSDIEKIISLKIKQRTPSISSKDLKKWVSLVKDKSEYLEFGARKIDNVLEELEFKYSS